RNDDRLTPLGGSPANAAAEFDLQASDGSDVRTDDEAIATDAIKAGPEKMRKPIRENGIDRRHERDVIERDTSFITPDRGNRVEALGVIFHDTIARRYTRSYSSADRSHEKSDDIPLACSCFQTRVSLKLRMPIHAHANRSRGTGVTKPKPFASTPFVASNGITVSTSPPVRRTTGTVPYRSAYI